LSFNFARPKGHYGTGKNSKFMKDNAPDFHTQIPDIDNLIKFVLDACNKHLYVDDKLVVDVNASKNWSADASTHMAIQEYA